MGDCVRSCDGTEGLAYFFLVLILMNTCGGCGGSTDETHERLDRIEERLEQCLPETP